MSSDQSRIKAFWNAFWQSMHYRSFSFRSAMLLLMSLVVWVIASNLILFEYSVGRKDPWHVISTGAIISDGSIVVGAAIGFLFALPRSTTVGAPTGKGVQSPELAGVTIRPNTNLEEVSDWVTKIIIALTLTQLGKIPTAAGRLFDILGRALGDSTQDAVFAGCLVVFSSVFGFMIAWLATRIFIGRLMAASDDETLRTALTQVTRQDPGQENKTPSKGSSSKDK